MFTPYAAAHVTHAAGPRFSGDAAKTVITNDDFERARQAISAWLGYAPTPLVQMRDLAEQLSLGDIYYKHEGPRFGLGSFKSLGGSYAAFRILQREISREVGHDVPIKDIGRTEYAHVAKRTTVASATDGNHGRAVAWGAKRLGMPCQIYIHAEVSRERARAMEDLGARVTRIDGDYDASVDTVKRDAEQNGWFIVSDTSWPGYTETPRHVMAGYGVMVHEIVSQLGTAPTHVFLQGGVGGLAASVAACLRQQWGDQGPRVIVVEPDLAPCLMASARAGKATAAPIGKETIMAGLSCGEPSRIAWQILAEEASDFLTIPDAVIPGTVRLMARTDGGGVGLEVGESAVAGLAGLMCAAHRDGLRADLGLNAGSRILLIGSEGVTDRTLYEKIMRGLELKPGKRH